MWKIFDRKTIKEGLMVLAYHPDWICEDFCPNGVREGYYCDGVFFSAKWDNDSSNWWAKKGFPTHYMEQPKFLEPVDYNQLNVFDKRKRYLYKDLPNNIDGKKDLTEIKLGDSVEVCLGEIPNKSIGFLNSMASHAQRIGAKSIQFNYYSSGNYLRYYQVFTFSSDG